MDERIQKFELYAWIGEDEYGSGVIGLKHGYSPVAMRQFGVPVPIALCAKGDHLDRMEAFAPQLQAQADQYQKTIRLCRFVFAEEVIVIEPRAWDQAKLD